MKEGTNGGLCVFKATCSEPLMKESDSPLISGKAPIAPSPDITSKLDLSSLLRGSPIIPNLVSV